MKRLNLVLLGLGLVFLACLVWKVGPGELWRQLSALGWGVLLLILAEGLANLAHTVAWQCCIHESQTRVRLWRLFCMASAGYAINYLTPTASVGGDVSRAALLASDHKGSQAVTSVLLDKLMSAVAHLLLVMLGGILLCLRVSLPGALWLAMAGTTALLIGGTVAFILLQKYGKLGGICRWLVEHRLGGRAMQQAAQHISEVDEALKQFYRQYPWDLALSVGWHLLGHSVALLHAWLFLWLLGQPAPFTTVAAAGILALWFDLLTFMIPMNLGTLEGSRLVIFKALGCQALLGMAFGVAVRIAQVFWAGFGLACYAWLADVRNRPEAAARCQPTVARQDSPRQAP